MTETTSTRHGETWRDTERHGETWRDMERETEKYRDRESRQQNAQRDTQLGTGAAELTTTSAIH